MDAPTFRTNNPEFADPTAYTDAMISLWLGIAAQLVNADRWGDLTDHGIELFAAHHIALQAIDGAAAANGGTPGIAKGAVSAESVDKVSVSYDTAATIEENAGHWNNTTYGRQFIRLLRMFGAGGVQI